eukprot:5133328-Pyramimonas_sp.AAC.1
MCASRSLRAYRGGSCHTYCVTWGWPMMGLNTQCGSERYVMAYLDHAVVDNEGLLLLSGQILFRSPLPCSTSGTTGAPNAWYATTQTGHMATS